MESKKPAETLSALVLNSHVDKTHYIAIAIVILNQPSSSRCPVVSYIDPYIISNNIYNISFMELRYYYICCSIFLVAYCLQPYDFIIQLKY